MKIVPLSDLHNEHSLYMNKLPEADVCVLAGDILVASSLFREHSKHGKNMSTLFRRIAAKYKHVVQIMGNHEHYQGEFSNTAIIINEFLNATLDETDRQKWHLLDDSSVMIEGVKFVGSTLWSDFNGGSRASMEEAQRFLNDYHVITHYGQVLQPGNTLSKHMKATKFIKEQIDSNTKTVVVSHHAPSLKSRHARYKNDVNLNGAYSSDLDYLVEEVDNVPLWFHGHTHDAFDYLIRKTRVVCNPRGYAGWERTDGFKPMKIVEI